MAASRIRIWKIIALALVLWASFSVVTYFAWIRGSEHRDLYPWWAAARLRIFEGRDVYDLETVRQMQIMLYGAPRPPEMDQQAFHYPSQMLVLLYPLWWIDDREIAAAIWTGLSALLLLASLWLLQRIHGSPLPALLAAALVFWQYPALMLFQAQATPIPLFALTAAFWAWKNRRDFLSGAVLALALVKPELCLFPWAVLLFFAFREKRWKVFAGFAGVHLLLFLLSLLVAGWWIPGWLGAINRYSGYAASVWIPGAAWRLHPLLLLALAALVAAAFWRTRWTQISAYSASIPLGILLLPQTLMWNLTVLLIPLALAWSGRARWLIAVIWLLGWTMMLLPSHLWYLQTMLQPALTLAAVAFSWPRQINSKAILQLISPSK